MKFFKKKNKKSKNSDPEVDQQIAKTEPDEIIEEPPAPPTKEEEAGPESPGEIIDEKADEEDSDKLEESSPEADDDVPVPTEKDDEDADMEKEDALENGGKDKSMDDVDTHEKEETNEPASPENDDADADRSPDDAPESTGDDDKDAADKTADSSNDRTVDDEEIPKQKKNIGVTTGLLLYFHVAIKISLEHICEIPKEILPSSMPYDKSSLCGLSTSTQASTMSCWKYLRQSHSDTNMVAIDRVAKYEAK